MPFPENNLLVLQQPIEIYTRNIGRLDLAVDISSDISTVRLLQHSFLVALFILLIALGTVIAILVELIVSRPIHKLAIASDNVSKGKYSAHLPRAGSDEVGHLVKSFKSMRDALQSYKNRVEQEIEGHKNTAKELEQQRERLVLLPRDRHTCPGGLCQGIPTPPEWRGGRGSPLRAAERAIWTEQAI